MYQELHPVVNVPLICWFNGSAGKQLGRWTNQPMAVWILTRSSGTRKNSNHLWPSGELGYVLWVFVALFGNKQLFFRFARQPPGLLTCWSSISWIFCDQIWCPQSSRVFLYFSSGEGVGIVSNCFVALPLRWITFGWKVKMSFLLGPTPLYLWSFFGHCFAT